MSYRNPLGFGLRQVGTNCRLPYSTLAPPDVTMNCRCPVIFRESVTSVQVGIPTWSSSGASFTGNSTIKASIEYPSGTMTQLLWSASATNTQAGGLNTLSDACAVTIPAGALAWIRIYFANTNGIPVYFNTASLNGGGYENGAAVTDKSMSGSIGGTGAAVFNPALIVARTKKRAALLLGDSIMQGEHDAVDYTNLIGIVDRNVGQWIGTLNCGEGGQTRQGFIASHTPHLALAQYFTDVVLQYNANDVSGGRTVAQMLADDQTIIGYFPGKIIHQLTGTPQTTTTDAWATVANQTSSVTTVHNDINDAIRRYQPGVHNVIDVARVVESTIDSRKWTLADGVPTSDGVHPAPLMYKRVQRSGVFMRNMFEDRFGPP